MIGNNPSYIIPRELLDYHTSWDLIEEISRRYVSEIQSHPGSNLEIEVKTGYILLGRDQGAETFKHFLFTLSHRDFVIVGFRSTKSTLQNYFGVRDFVGEAYHLSKEKMSKKRFLDVKNYFEKESALYPGKIKESKTEFSIDFGMADGSRVTYDLINNSWKRIKKEDRTTIDILHKAFPYRLSYAFEETLEFNEAEFITMHVRNIRIKNRKCYTLEYIEYMLTEVVQYEQGEYKLDDLKTAFLAAKNKGEEALERYAELQLKLQEEYEIELEIADKELFSRTVRGPDFGSYFKRFIRNAEGIFLIPKIYHEQISMQYCESELFAMPRIGQYFSEYHLEKIKPKD